MALRKNIIACVIGTLFVLMASPFLSQAQFTPDPGIVGPYAVTKGEYNLGDLAWTTPSFPNPIEVRASVHYPTGLTGGPYPMIVLLHGRHSVCYNTATMTTGSFTWPCPTGQASIESFQGYDYHARHMASHGYIVISISCNAINAADNPLSDRGMNARGELIQHHLDLWNTWNTTGDAPTSLGAAGMWVGKANLQKIGTMGHSRGGEGVVFHALYNRSLGSPYGVKAVLTLAPVDFMRRKLNGIALMNIAPYCDGDVSDLQGVHFYDDVRYTDTTDLTPKYTVLMMGANHNFYNTVWTPFSGYVGGSDDWGASSSDPHCGASVAGNKRYDTLKQKMAYKAYAAAFFRQHVGGEQQFAPILETRDLVPPASSTLDTSNVFASYHPGHMDRRDINRTDTLFNQTTNTMLSSVSQSGLLSSGICGGGLTIPLCAVATQQAKEPHRGTASVKGLAQMGMRWNDTTDWYSNDIPAANQNLTLVDAVQFRGALRYNECTPGQSLNFTVQLIDSAGAVSSTEVRNWSRVMFYPPGGTSSTLLPKVMFNTIRIPISNFTGINLAKVRKVKFLFNKSAAGSILISDLTFVNAKCGIVNGTTGFSYDTVGYDVSFFDTVVVNTGDTVTRLWNFGNPASGTNDTSTLHNPTHVFTSAGTYNVCFYTIAKRKNNWICVDTVCTSITVVPPIFVPTTTVESREIKIIPNPARDYMQVIGAESTDVLRLINTVGQVVLTTQITDPIISLPAHLVNGVYYAIITSKDGQQAYKKMVISR